MERDTLQQKEENLLKLFASCRTDRDKYAKLIELGRKLPEMKECDKRAEKRVKGCQSSTFIYAKLEEGALRLQASSDALVSAGLAYLLCALFNGEAPETVVKEPFSLAERLGLPALLTPSRANGLSQMVLHIKREALALLLEAKQPS